MWEPSWLNSGLLKNISLDAAIITGLRVQLQLLPELINTENTMHHDVNLIPQQVLAIPSTISFPNRQFQKKTKKTSEMKIPPKNITSTHKKQI